MAETGSFELPQKDKEKQQNQPKQPENKPKDTSSDKGEHRPNRVMKYFKEVRDELKKVEWPKRKDIIRGTVVVIVFSIALAIVLGAADEGFSYLLQKALEVFNQTSL